MAIHALFIGNPVNRVQEKAVAFTQGVALQMIEAGKLPLIAVLLRERFRRPGNQGVIFLQFAMLLPGSLGEWACPMLTEPLGSPCSQEQEQPAS